MNLLNLQNLCIDFEDNGRRLPVVSRVSFTVDRGEILALVGESGCGKSISCMALTGLLPSPPAHVRAESIGFRFRGDEVELADASSRLLRQIRGAGSAFLSEGEILTGLPGILHHGRPQGVQ